jgi:hypothetical protein
MRCGIACLDGSGVSWRSLALTLLLLTACRGDEAPGAPTGPAARTASSASTSAPAAPVPATSDQVTVVLDGLHDQRLLEAVASAVNAPVVVEPRAEAVLGHGQLSVNTGGRVPRARAAEAIDAALQLRGLELRQVGAGYLIEAKAPTGEATASALLYALPPWDVDPAAANKLLAAVREVSPLEREVREEARDLIFANLAGTLLTTEVRFLHETDTSIRVLGIRPDSVLSKLGLENGDVVTGFGARDASAESALLALADLATATEGALRITRRGKPVMLRYRMLR